MKKRILVLLLLVSICMMALVSCGGEDDDFKGMLGNKEDVEEEKEEFVSVLYGTYKYTGKTSLMDWYLTFKPDGSLKVTEHYGSAGTSSKHGKYEINGNTIIISNIGYTLGCPGIAKDGEYTFTKKGDKIIINEAEWAVSNIRLPEESPL